MAAPPGRDRQLPAKSRADGAARMNSSRPEPLVWSQRETMTDHAPDPKSKRRNVVTGQPGPGLPRWRCRDGTIMIADDRRRSESSHWWATTSQRDAPDLKIACSAISASMGKSRQLLVATTKIKDPHRLPVGTRGPHYRMPHGSTLGARAAYSSRNTASMLLPSRSSANAA
jgi:hypothetical protein